MKTAGLEWLWATDSGAAGTAATEAEALKAAATCLQDGEQAAVELLIVELGKCGPVCLSPRIGWAGHRSDRGWVTWSLAT